MRRPRRACRLPLVLQEESDRSITCGAQVSRKCAANWPTPSNVSHRSVLLPWQLFTQSPQNHCADIYSHPTNALHWCQDEPSVSLSLSLSPTISLGTIYDHVHIDSLRSRLSRSRFEKERLYTGTTLNLRLRAGPCPSAANNLENHSPCQPLHPNTVPLFTSDEHSKFFHSGRIPETLTTAKTSTDTGEPAAAILEHIEPWREKGLQPAAG